MPTQLHKNLTGADAVHPAAFVQASDPGAVGANLQWIDTTTGPPYTLKLRNAANTAWLVFAAGATGATGLTGVQGSTGAQGSAGAITVSITGGQPYICIQDQKPLGTAGGTFTSGAWRTRTLNTILANDLNIAVLDTSTSRITLPAGTYRCYITCPAELTNSHQSRLQSITSSSTLLPGTSENVGSGGHTIRSIIAGKFAISQTHVIEVQHQASATSATNGFGVPASFGVEVYTIAEFWLVDGPPPFFGSSLTMALPSFETPRRQARVARQDILLPGGNG